MITHYSPSQLNLANECGRKYYYQYLAKVPRPSTNNIFFILGSAADRTVEKCLTDRSKSVGETFNKELATELEGVILTDDEKAGIDRQSTLLQISLINYFNNHIDYEPVSFQRKMSIRLKGVGPQVFGYADIIAKRGDKNLIIDIKTSSKQVKEASPAHVSQVMFYALCLMKMDDLDEIPDLELHYLVKTKEPKINIVKVEATPSHFYHLISSIRAHDWKIKQGFFPMNRSSIWCSQSGCEFYEHCHNENKLDATEAIKQLI